MAKLSDERIKEFKDIFEKQQDKEISWQEASEGAYNLVGFFETLFDIWVRDQQRKERLKKFPNGFQIEGIGYSCAICGIGTQENSNWYDKYGIKCMTCQKAIDKKVIPASLAKNKESWYSKYEIESYFNVKSPTLRSWIKQGILRARTVTNDGGGVHVQLFLIKDNKDTLPPKKLLKSYSVKETKDGQDWYHSEPWYKFVDPVEHLKGYKIMSYLQVTYKEGEK